MSSRPFASPAVLQRFGAIARGLAAETWLAFGIAAGALVLRFYGLNAPLDNYDEGSYVATLRLMTHGAPLYGAISFGQTPFFLYSLLPWFIAVGQTLLAARIGIFAYSMLGLAAAWWIGRALGGRRVALLALLLVAVDPLYLMQSRSVQAEAPTLAWALVALAAAVWYTQRPDRRLALLAGAALAAAVLTKLAGALVAPSVLWFLLRPAWSKGTAAGKATPRLSATRLEAMWKAARTPLLWSGVGLAFAAVLILAPVVPYLGALWQQVFAIRVSAEHLPGFSRGDNLGVIVSAWWEAPLLALAVVGAVSGMRRRDGAVLGMSIWATLSVAVLLAQAPLFAHHLALATPPLALLAALAEGGRVGRPERARATPRARGAHAYGMGEAGMRRAVAAPEAGACAPRAPLKGYAKGAHNDGIDRSALRLTLVGAVVLMSLVTDVIQQSALIAQPPIAMLVAAHDLKRMTRPHDLVVTDDPIITVLADRDVPPNLADSSLVRIAAGMLTSHDVEAMAGDPHVTAILWYSGRFDRLPGLRAWVAARFVEVVSYGGGRGLFLRRAAGAFATGAIPLSASGGGI